MNAYTARMGIVRHSKTEITVEVPVSTINQVYLWIGVDCPAILTTDEAQHLAKVLFEAATASKEKKGNNALTQ